MTWRIRNKDCITAMCGNILVRCPRLIVADPPYNLGVDYGFGKSADRLPEDEYRSWSWRWLYYARGIVAPDGSLWIVAPDEQAAMLVRTLGSDGWYLRRWIIWVETFGVHNSAGTNFSRGHRHILYAVRDPKRFVFHGDAVRVPSARQTKYNDKRADPRGRMMSDVWTDIPRLCGTFNERIKGVPTQLPVRLIDRIVRVASDPGDLVLDPFCGSGTTGEAAIRNSRDFLGFDLNPEYCKLTCARLRRIEKELAKQCQPTRAT